MIRPRTPLLVLLLPGLIGALVAPQPAAGQNEDPRLKRVFADWQTRRERIKRVRYTVSGVEIKPKGSFTDDLGRPLVPPRPPEDISQPLHYRFLLDLEGQRFRLESTSEDHAFGPGGNGGKTSVSVLIYDGKDCWVVHDSEVGSPGPEAYQVSLVREDGKFHPLRKIVWLGPGPVLFGHGLLAGLAEPPAFAPQFEAADFVVHGQGVQAGHKCLVIRSLPLRQGTDKLYEEYWVDPTQESSVVRYRYFRGGVLVTNTDIEYQKTANGWLPVRWTATPFAAEGKIAAILRMSVTDFLVDPPATPSDYQPEIRPGMRILQAGDGGAGARRLWHVAPDGSWNEVIDGVEQTTLRKPLYWLAVLIVPTVTIGLWLVWRRRRRLIAAAQGLIR